jgi:hypothetical protein
VLEKSVLTGATVGDEVMLPTVCFAANETLVHCVVKTKYFFNKSSIRSDRKQIAEANVYL